MPRRTDLTQPIDTEQYARADVALGLLIGLAEGKQAIDRDGGDYGAGLIRGAAVITRGEALGHEMWIDKYMLEQVHDALAAAGEQGIKARFTHPGLSSDGLGTFLGRFKSPKLDGDVVRADLHIMPSAHNTPDGDLAGYLLDLAEDDPAAFGTSIVFRRDLEAEDRHQRAYTAGGVFQSPDVDNENNWPHARLRQLRAVDAVDSPAANPNGLFHRQELGAEAEALAAYALGLSNNCPQLTSLSVNPDRIAGFARRFLDRHGLAITKKGPAMPPKQPRKQLAAGDHASGVLSLRTDDAAGALTLDEGHTVASGDKLDIAWEGGSRSGATAGDVDGATVPFSGGEGDPLPEESTAVTCTVAAADEPEPEAAPEAGASAKVTLSQADVQRYQKAFGSQGLEWLLSGKSFDQAKQLHAQQQAKVAQEKLAAELKAKESELAAAKQETEHLRQRLDALKAGSGEQEPLAFTDGESGKGSSDAAKFTTTCGDKLGRYAASLKLAKK